MSERRISPEDSARLHPIRHESYAETAKKRKGIELMDDEKLLDTLSELMNLTRAQLSRSTSQRVRLRLLAQEAHKRGLGT